MQLSKNCPYCGRNFTEMVPLDAHRPENDAKTIQMFSAQLDRTVGRHMESCKSSPKAIADSQAKERRRAERAAERTANRAEAKPIDEQAVEWGAMILGFIALMVIINIYEWFIDLHWFFQGLIGFVILILVLGAFAGDDD